MLLTLHALSLVILLRSLRVVNYMTRHSNHLLRLVYTGTATAGFLGMFYEGCLGTAWPLLAALLLAVIVVAFDPIPMLYQNHCEKRYEETHHG